MKKPIIAAAALLALLSAARLPGQSYRSFQDERDAIAGVRLRLGPLRLVPRFRLTEAGYDSNVYYRGEEGEEDDPVQEQVAEHDGDERPKIGGEANPGSQVIA